MGCPLVGADYVGTCRGDRLCGCDSHGDGKLGWARTVGVSPPPDLSPAGDALSLLQVDAGSEPAFRESRDWLHFDNCASSISCWSISKANLYI